MNRLRAMLFILLLPASASAAITMQGSFIDTNASDEVAGWKIKIGAVSGGPYTRVEDCGKPAPVEGRIVCPVTVQDTMPVYAVAVAYDQAGHESGPSNEAEFDAPPAAPSGLMFSISGTIILTPVQ